MPASAAQTVEPADLDGLATGLPADPAAGVASSSLALGLLLAFIVAATFSALSTGLLRALLPQGEPAGDGAEAPGQGGPTSGVREKDDPSSGDSSEAAFSIRPGETELLAASAGLVAFCARAVAAALIFILALRALTVPGSPLLSLGAALAVTSLAGGLLLHLATLSIPLAIAQSHADQIVRRGVPRVAFILVPMTWVARMLAAIRRVLLRAVDTPDANYGTRRLVEGFRAMVEGAEMQGDLAAETRELIANVIEFGAADAAEVMTPRTEIEAIDAEASLNEAIAVFAASGFSRIPVYVETVDTIIGTLTALEAAKAVAEDRLATTSIRSVMRPPLLVPETQLVPELLGNFRAQRQKMAIVVDEYGGTAGLVTLADVMAEIVGHVQDEFEEEEPPAFQRLEDGSVQIDASEHVADINEEAFLDLPEEEDYETLAGFVLSELGRFPAAGESFVKGGIRYLVAEANDRRVLKVVLKSISGTIQLASERAEDHSAGARPSATDSGPGHADGKNGGRLPESRGKIDQDRENLPPIAS